MTNGKSKSNRIKTSYIRFGNRTYFFDVNQAANEKKYLRITESKFQGEGKDRQYNSFILFPENIKDFQKNLAEIVSFLS